MMQIGAWPERYSRWNQLRALGSSNLVRASVLMPAFGYMLLLNERAQDFLTLQFDGWLLAYLPNLWRVWLLFYGSFFLAAATLLFSAYCPSEVKRYQSAFDMADGEVIHQRNLQQFPLVQKEVALLYSSAPPWMRTVLGNIGERLSPGKIQHRRRSAWIVLNFSMDHSEP